MITDNLEYITTEEAINNEFEYYKKTPGRLGGVSTKNEIVKFFQQDTFFAVEKELFKDKNIHDKLINNRIKYLNKSEEELTNNDILTGFKKSAIYYGYSHFNPLWFKWFIEKYECKRCYDPCGGWGHRLLGAQDLELYIYNDLSYHTACNVQNIADYFNMTNVEFFNEDCRECTPWTLFDYDSVFTCPPYYNLEHYECGDFENIDEFYGILDVLDIQFTMYDKCKVMGIVLREDLLPDYHQDYTEKFELNVHKAEHILKNTTKKNKEYLYVWKK